MSARRPAGASRPQEEFHLPQVGGEGACVEDLVHLQAQAAEEAGKGLILGQEDGGLQGCAVKCGRQAGDLRDDTDSGMSFPFTKQIQGDRVTEL